MKIKTSHNTGKANNVPQKTTLSTFDDEACTNMEQTCEIHSVLKTNTHRQTDRRTERQSSNLITVTMLKLNAHFYTHTHTHNHKQSSIVPRCTHFYWQALMQNAFSFLDGKLLCGNRTLWITINIYTNNCSVCGGVGLIGRGTPCPV